MKRSNRCVTVLLAAILLFGAASCSESEANKDGSESKTQEISAENSPESAVEETEKSDIDLLPDADYEGFYFNILSTDPNCLWGWRVSLYAEEETGEPLNDAVFRRNVAVEDRYNIRITDDASRDSVPTSDTAKRTALAGDDVYSVMSYGVKWQLVDAQTGCFLNLYKVESIDFDAPWWNRECADLLTIQGKLYPAFTAFNVFDNEALGAIYVNNDLVDDFNLESPYDLVREGRWTFDAMYELETAASLDKDGDGLMSPGDTVGWVGGIGSFNVFLTAANQPHVLIGEDGSYILNQGTDGSIAAAEKIARVMNDKSASAYLNEQGWAGTSFAEGSALMREGGVANLSTFRELEFSLGVVPPPKFDEAQKQYRTMASNQSMTIVIPKPNADPERTGVICSALGAYSRVPLREVYYETMLKKKAARDEETVEMLDIILAGKSVDAGVLNENAWGTVISGYFNSIRASGADQLASVTVANIKQFGKMVEKSEAKYSEID